MVGHTHEWVTSHTWMSHVTHMNESCHTWMSHIAHYFIGAHDSFMCVTRPIHVCDMTRLWVWLTHLWMWHDSFMSVTWLIHEWHAWYCCAYRMILDIYATTSYDRYVTSICDICGISIIWCAYTQQHKLQIAWNWCKYSLFRAKVSSCARVSETTMEWLRFRGSLKL